MSEMTLKHAFTLWRRTAELWKTDPAISSRVNPDALSALLTIAERNVPAVLQLRCESRGHLLLSIHTTRYGLLLWMVPRKHRIPPRVQERFRGLAEEDPALRDYFRGNDLDTTVFQRLGFRHDLLPEAPDAYLDTLPVFCRCSARVINLRDMFDEAEVARTQNQQLVVRASLCERR